MVIETVLIVTQDVKGLSSARQGKNISMFDRIRDQAKNFAFVCSPACAKRSLGGKLAKSECAKDFFSADRVKMDGAEMESRRAGFIS